ncbi:hypothetical protein DKX38_013122 [Salix brachista]|uniref:Transcription repressor n=1 Tax=Salix brachista TaxID=2182728 RepID=A0A5N5LQS8_9ROSI|nr:hypothetical protein DKX38_013122 [Salix brachista]
MVFNTLCLYGRAIRTYHGCSFFDLVWLVMPKKKGNGDLNGRLGVFGLAKFHDHGSTPQTTNVAGTVGYLAPEITRTGKATTSVALRPNKIPTIQPSFHFIPVAVISLSDPIKRKNARHLLEEHSQMPAHLNPILASTNLRVAGTPNPNLDFATILASHRFFFSSPGRSNSIIESLPEPQTPVSGGVAVKKYSPDPYTDFKHSMQEMIEARELRDVRANWDYLHELLSCYLELNPKHTHKFIISAFADIVVCLLSSPET